MSRQGRLGMVDREHPFGKLRTPPRLSLVRQCTLLGLSRSSLYYRPAGVDEYDLNLMRLIDRQYLETPFYIMAYDVSEQVLRQSQTFIGGTPIALLRLCHEARLLTTQVSKEQPSVAV